MSVQKYSGYKEEDLKTFAVHLQTEYYDAVELLCAKIIEQAQKVGKRERSAGPLEYASVSERIMAGILRHIKARKEIYMPYVVTLAAKVREQHDCTHCTGTCAMDHDVHLLELKATNDDMKKMLARMQDVVPPDYSESIFPDDFRLMRSCMTLLETDLTELFFLENNFLVPKIAEAKKQINARNR